MQEERLREKMWWRGALCVVLIAWAVRLVAAGLLPSTGDESVLAWQTIEGILQGKFFIYLYHNRYMFPLHEYVSAVLWRIWEPSLFLLRVPAALFGGLAAGLWWLALAPLWENRRIHVLLGVYLAIPSMANLNYEIPAAPTYGMGHLLVAVLFWMTMKFPSRAGLGWWVGMGIFAGLAIWIFPLIKVPFGLALVWLAVRDTEWRQAVLPVWRAGGSSVWIGIGSGLIGGVAAAAGLYHYLTRAEGYQLPSRLIPVWIMAAVGLGVAGVILIAKVKVNWKPCLRSLAIGMLAILLAAIPEMAFQAQFRLLPHEEQMLYNNGADTSMEHRHHWPVRTQFTLQSLLPQAVLGLRAAKTQGVEHGYVTELDYMPWRLALGAAVMLLWAVGFWRGWKRESWRPALMVVGGSVFAVTILFCVTYKSANFYNYRYLAAFSPGIFLLFAAAFKELRWRTLFLSALVAVGCVDFALALLR